MITVLGIGPGAPDLQLIKSRQVLTTAQVVIGSPRFQMLLVIKK